MSTGPGNDPFSGSNTRNIINHLVSPKIINDGSGGYTVKTDLINIDNAYMSGKIYSNGYNAPPIGYAAGLGTVSPISIQETISGTTGTAIIQAGPSLGTNPASLNGIAKVVFSTDTTTNKTSIALQANNGSSVNTVLTTAYNKVSTVQPISVDIDTSVGGTQHYILANNTGATRWAIGLQDLETGSNSGSNFNVYSYNDATVFLLKPLSIDRATGYVSTPVGFYGKSKGTFTFSGSTCVVSDTKVGADSDILITLKTLGGTGTGQAYISGKVASTGFTVSSVAGAGDTSTYNYIILN